MCDYLEPLNINSFYPIFNLDLHRGEIRDSVQSYFDLCSKASDLLVTTSSFAEWKKGKNTNGSAKVIPAVPVGGKGQPLRVFFFDDNINLSLGSAGSNGRGVGACDAKGICNLRNIETGEFVDFSAGKNGFACDTAFRHTLIHHSPNFQNVLVQANILDAMSNVDYFSGIICKYYRPGEKLIVFMDVNGTILWNDSIMGMGPCEILLGTMFTFTEVRPRNKFEISWENGKVVEVSKPQQLKQLMQDCVGGDLDVFHEFWRKDKCEQFFKMFPNKTDLGWIGQERCFSLQEFFVVYAGYLDNMYKQTRGDCADNDIVASWFRCSAMLRRGGHSIVINSFGMDTHKVVMRSAADARRILHIAVNFEEWSDRDREKFRQQFDVNGVVRPAIRRRPACWPWGKVPEYDDDGCFVTCSGPKEIQVPDHVFVYTVRRPSHDVNLGVVVAHREGYLEVTQILSKGTVYAANRINKGLTPPEEMLMVGDRVSEVNDTSKDTKAMVEKCKQTLTLTFTVTRPLRLVHSMGWCGQTMPDPFLEELVTMPMNQKIKSLTGYDKLKL